MEETITVPVESKKNSFLVLLSELSGKIFKKKEVETINSKEEILRDELDDALLTLKIAETNFDNALPEFLDIANEELTIAKKRVEVIIKKIKKISKS